MNMEILFTRPVTEDVATALKVVKCDDGFSISIETIYFIDHKKDYEAYHFIKTESIDEFIGMLQYLKSTL